MKVIFIIGDEDVRATLARWREMEVHFRTPSNLSIALRLCTSRILRQTQKGLLVGYFDDVRRDYISAWLPKSQVETKGNLIVVPDWIDHPCAFRFLVKGSFASSAELEEARLKAAETIAALPKEELEDFLLGHAERGAEEIIWTPQTTEMI